MANTYEQILALLKDASGKDKNIMGLSNTIMRDNGIPLDFSSVQENYDSALAYAKSGIAYIGQPISVGDTLYIVTDEANGYLKPVGTQAQVSGDDASITVEDGKLTLKGFAAAANATLPQKKADGTLEWVTLDALLDGDGNTKTVVASADESKITVESTYDEDTDTHTYTLDVQFPAIPGYSIASSTEGDNVTYQLTKDGIAVGDKIVIPNAYNDSGLQSRVAGVEAGIADHESRLAGIELFFDDAAQDEGEGENLKNALNTLKEIQQYVTEDGQAAKAMSEAVAANTAALETINGEGEGSIKKAIADQALADASKYALKADVSEVRALADAAATKSELEAGLAAKVDNTALAGYYTKQETYSKETIDEFLSNITGTNGDTAASVAAELALHKAANDKSFEAIAEKDGTQDTAIATNADAINAINNETTGILAQAKKDAQDKIDALITEGGAIAVHTADIAAINSQIEKINSNFTGLQGTVEDINTTVGAIEPKVTGLETDFNAFDAALKAEIAAREALGTTVKGITDVSIVALQAKDDEFAAQIAANTAKFNTYSTTDTVEGMIADAIAGIDNSATGQNTTAINDEITRAKAEEARLAGLIESNADHIATNASNIAALETTINAAIENNDDTALNSIKELAAWINEHNHDTSVLASISANTTAIEVLNGTGAGSVKKTVEDAIADIPYATAAAAGLVKTSDEVYTTAEGYMQLGAVSTDKLTQGSQTLVLLGGSATSVTGGNPNQ
jgi:predicted  nucleic acid-binding Zn-ribbon protein